MKLSWIHATLALVLSNNALLSHQTYQDVNKIMLFKWKTPEFEYPSEEARTEAIERKRFIPQNAIVLDADYYAGRYFVTLPPFRPGVPASLAEVLGEQTVLRPFPRKLKLDEKTNLLSCNGPHSVFRIYIDKCGLMWALDSGLSNPGMFDWKRHCPPKLMAYDLNNGDREILRYVFPEEDFVARSNPTTFAVESYRYDCSDSILYITDEMGHGMVVFDYAQKTSWRLEDPSFYPWPDQHRFAVNGIMYSVMAGIFGITLGPVENDRKLYFHAFSSLKESWMPVAVLKNKTTALTDRIRGPSVVTSPGERAGQSTVEVMTDDGILIYHLLATNSLVCWNSRTPFTIENQHVLERDDVNFQYISAMKLKDNNLLFTSCRYQNFLYGLENATDYNYRVMVIENVKSLIANTPCANAQTSVNDVGFENNNYITRNFNAYPANSQVSSDENSLNYITSRFGASPNAISVNSLASADVSSSGAYLNAGAVNSGVYSDAGANRKFGASPSVVTYGGYVGGPNSVLSDASYQKASRRHYVRYPQTDSSYGFSLVTPFGQYSNGDWSVKNGR